MYSKRYCAILEKKTILDASEKRSAFALSETRREVKKFKNYVCKKKKKKSRTKQQQQQKALMLGKQFIPSYLKPLMFQTKGTGLKVTKINSHYTFEKETF